MTFRHRLLVVLSLLLGLVVPFGGMANATPTTAAAPAAVADPSTTGPYQVDQVAAQGNDGFAGGTIYVPHGLSGLLGGVAIVPGFIEPQVLISWLGPQLASHGFAVITIDSKGPFDFPDPRGDQLLAALDYLTTSSPVADRVDPNRLAVAGHSMGGGGTLAAAVKRPSLKAAIPLAPWHSNTDWSAVRTPTLIVGAESDVIAPVARHSIPFYESIPASVPKAYLEMKGADHFVTNGYTPEVARQATSWLKVFVAGDTDYEQFLCPGPQPNDTISQYRSNCPY